jgi:hypothetical protein
MSPRFRTSSPRKAPPAAQAELDREARRFGRYLVGEVPPREFIDRYIAAHKARREDLQLPSVAVDVVARRPWLIPWLDAACAVLRPDDALRRKLLLMVAVLECSPHYADRFLPKRRSVPLLIIELAWIGLRSAILALGGIVVFWWALRRTNDARHA